MEENTLMELRDLQAISNISQTTLKELYQLKMKINPTAMTSNTHSNSQQESRQELVSTYTTMPVIECDKTKKSKTQKVIP